MTFRSLFMFCAMLMAVPFVVNSPKRTPYRAYMVNGHDVYAARNLDEAITVALESTNDSAEIWDRDEIYEVDPSTLIDWGLTGDSVTSIQYEMDRMTEPGQICGTVLLRYARRR